MIWLGPTPNTFLEDQVGRPGKILKANLVDTDGDKVPGYADGIDRNGQEGDGASEPFYPLMFELGGSVFDPAQATVRFKYAGSNPAGVEKVVSADETVSYTLAPGALRLWIKDGQFSRKVADIAQGGDYVVPDKAYPLSWFEPVAGADAWTLFVEGVRGVTSAEEKQITLTVDPDGEGPLAALEGDLVLVTSIFAGLVPDYNHNRQIDEEDRARAAQGDIFYFWINDDDDEGETGGDDIPLPAVSGQESRRDCDNFRIDGVRDLIDFFPVALDVKTLAQIFPPNVYTYHLKSADENLKVAFPDLSVATVKNYLEEVETARRLAEAPTKQLRASGEFLVTLGEVLSGRTQAKLDELISAAATQDTSPVILLEGGKPSTSPLVLEIKDQVGNQVFLTSLNLSLDGVEQMFRHVNLLPTIDNPKAPAVEIGQIGEHGAEGGEKSRYNGDDFSNRDHFNGFDGELSERYFALLHGVNVDGQQARGFHSEIFKRLYWSGSKAKLVGVTWYGAEGIDANYQPNVVNAFKTAAQFGQEVAKATQNMPVSIMAHSLGNMVVSSYLNDYYQQHPLNVRNYILVNAAVALEAYLGDYQGYAEGQLDNPDKKTFDSDNSMVHSNWHGYDKRLGSSEWHQLFGADDSRRTLTWRSRFANLPESINYYSFYSSGDEVLATYTGESPDIQFPDVWNSNLRRYAWVLQEKWKGRDLPFASTDLMGWGFNQNNYRTTEIVDGGLPETHPWFPTIANSLVHNDQLLTEPFFRKPGAGQLGHLLFEPTFDEEYVKGVRDQLLALVLPSLTLVTGGWLGEDIQRDRRFSLFVNMNDPSKKNDWPSNRGLDKDWKHSDIKDVAYVFSKEIFKQIVENGGL
ncbi:hypothetical protein DSOUD_2771 [Desulfuromonas soudanensis]|uniref:Alpha/beta hydrolase n=1 Tax=Desulfuromonas soudanensis TaxID=1603606 RepID=A0A0M3QG78_9BACT|nr:hypothetical protein [Desulfuromonas soudanensis]ALC17509.1 hypothetical protein DSOUD_2771 [Desulfuromonas soudanensis]